MHARALGGSLVLFGALALAPGCSSASGAGSCFNSSDRCTDYVGSGYTASRVQGLCILVYSADPCPSTKRVGRCQFNASLPTENIQSFYSPGWTTDMAKQECVAGGVGTWLGP